MRLLRTILRNHRGATAIEYALVAALIAVAAIAAFKNLGGQVDSTFNGVHGVMENATT
jgi:pilus assembly protein Flp/PilA